MLLFKFVLLLSALSRSYAAPGPVEMLMATAKSTSVLLNWNIPLMANGSIIAYEVKYYQARDPDHQTTVNVRDANSFEVNALTPETMYIFMVRVHTPTETGDWQKTNATTLPAPKETDIAGGAAGGSVTLFVAAVAVVVICVVWMKKRKKCFFATTRSMTATSEDTQHATSGFKKEKAVHVKEDQSKLEIEEFPKDTYTEEGRTLSLQVKVKGTPIPTLNWYHNEELILEDYSTTIYPDGTLQISSVKPRHVGVYRLVAANEFHSCSKELRVTLLDSDESWLEHREIEFSPVPRSEFPSYVMHNHARNNQGFKEQYKFLESRNHHPAMVAMSAKNRPLNRFKDIVPYDDNRIVLNPIPGVKGYTSNYINASYVDGYCNADAFIVTQAPLPKTLTHFWHLVWQEKPKSILMLTNLKEGSKIKCQKYWPDLGNMSFGPFNVAITNQQVFADYTIRRFQVTLFGRAEESHSVTQFHFTEWPDHGVPENATAVLKFYRRVMLFNNRTKATGPILVHCSAGVGRTGMFIVMDTVLKQMEKEQTLDIAGTINKIRQQRMKLVQTMDQFIFIHDAILEVVICGDTQIPTDNIYTAMEKLKRVEHGMTGLNSQFHVLNQVTPNPNEVPRTISLQYGKRNRCTSYLPPDKWRVPLQRDYPDYIHATFINAYKQQKAFIIAEGPMASTCKNFWKMVYERNCGAIVMLSDLVEEGKEACYCYWPVTGSMKYGDVSVEALSDAEKRGFDGYKVRKFSILVGSGEAHQVTQFCFENWDPSGRCANSSTILEVIDEVSKLQRRTGNNPIVVHCSDTVGRSGMFCTIATTIERCKTEGVVDVFQVLKAIRGHKPGAVATEEQYSYIFDAVLLYLDSFSTYANFK